MPEQVSYDEFKREWLMSVIEGNPPTVEVGRRFAGKLVGQWLDLGDSSDDVIYCDGSGDGGIDIAYLLRGESPPEDGAEHPTGDTWYLFQSKYGSAFAGTGTLIEEGRKIIDTLSGHRTNLSSLAEGLLERLQTFRSSASEFDRIILVFATIDSLNDDEKRALGDVRAMGRNRLNARFDVEAVSVHTVYQRTLEEMVSQADRIRVGLTGNLVSSGHDLLVGSVSLLNLYSFLKSYRSITEDLDQLYEKNVRKFLGGRGKVNRGVQLTLRGNPERFGLFNNGITIVVEDFRLVDGNSVELVEPFIVNGCQTTKTIWEVCNQRLEAGGTGSSPDLESWKERAAQGIVVTKIVKVGADGEDLLQAITRYTNSQNAVREKDFLALTSDFKTWARQMAESHKVFLEIQRGGWDSRKALQRQRPAIEQFSEAANAFDLLKVYGSGWLGEAGTAFRSNNAFVPDGPMFKKIMERGEGEEPFGVDDLYAAHRLQVAAEQFEFGRGATKPTRRQTRFFYYMIVMDLLKDVLIRAQKPSGRKDLTNAFLKLCEPQNETAFQALLNTAIEVVDEYLTDGQEDSAFLEPVFKTAFINDLNAFLKWDQLGKSEEATPRLRSLLAGMKKTMGRRVLNEPSPRDLVTTSIE